MNRDPVHTDLKCSLSERTRETEHIEAVGGFQEKELGRADMASNGCLRFEARGAILKWGWSAWREGLCVLWEVTGGPGHPICSWVCLRRARP